MPHPSPDRACLSWSCAALQSDCPKLASTRIGWMLPSCPWPFPAGLQGVRSLRLPCLLVKVDPEILSWAWALLQSAPSSEQPRGPSCPRRDPAAPCSSSHEVLLPFSVFPHAAAVSLAGFASPDHQRPQVFSTSRRVHPPRAYRPCFMPDPLMGLRPSEPCSSHAAVRRLRRLSPRDVARARDPLHTPAARRRSAVHRTQPHFAQAAETAAASRNHQTANGNTEVNPSGTPK